METLNAIDGLILGIMIYSGFSHWVAGLRGESLRDHLYFGFLTLFFAGYTYFNMAGVDASSPQSFFVSCRWEVNLGYLGLIPYAFFIRHYTKVKLNLFAKSILVLCLVTVVLNNVLNLPILFNAYSSEPYVMEWSNGTQYTVEGTVGWRLIADFAVLGLMFLSFRSVYLQYKRGNRNNALFLGAALLVFWFGMLWDNFSEFGNAYTIHVVKYSFMVWMLLMGFKLSGQIVETAFMKQQIEKARNRLVEILNHIPSIVFIKDQKGRYTFINEYSTTKFAMEPAMFMGKTDFDLFDESEANAFSRDDELAFSTGEISTFQNDFHLQGVQHTFLTQKVALRTEGEAELLGVAMDISRRKRMEDELITKQNQLEERNSELTLANAELDSFVYRVSHDFRAPLVSLMSLAQLVKSETDLDNTKQYAELMEKSAHRLDKYVRDVLDYSKNSRLEIKPELFDTQEVVDEVLASMHQQIVRRQIRIDLDLELTQVYTDYFRFRTILANLVSNAVQYQKDDCKEESCWIAIRTLNRNNNLVIEVEDNGIGIEPEVQEKMFDMFYRGSAGSQGSGIGLYIVKNCASLLNGKIEFETIPGKGTKFIVSLPELESEPKADEKITEQIRD